MNRSQDEVLSAMKKNRLCLGMIIGGLLLILTGCGSGGSGESDVTVLRAVTVWEQGDLQNSGFEMFLEKLPEASDGRLEIEYVGGPEAIPTDQQGEAVRTGVVDISNLSTAYYASQLPA